MVTTFDQQLAELFNSNFGIQSDWNWGNLLLCVLSILLSVILCGAVGLEREKRGRSAGLRTHLLVGVGSTIIMIISIYGFPQAAEDRDVARLAAQVVAGVGFLGAGTIVHNQGGIKGLTTASTIWLVMAIGLACGSMNFFLAIVGTILVMIVLTVFRKLERFVSIKNPFVNALMDANAPAMTTILDIAKKNNCTISDVTSNLVSNGKEDCLEFMFRLNSEDGTAIDIKKFEEDLRATGYLKSINIMNHH